jgi:hypothetical protein
MLAIIPKHHKRQSKQLDNICSRKLNYGSYEEYIHEEQKRSYVQLANIKRLLDLLMENAVYKHTAKAVDRQPRAEKKPSVCPNTVIEICPNYLVYPSAYREKYKQQHNISYNI